MPASIHDKTHAVVLASSQYPASLGKRVDVTLDILAERGVRTRLIELDAPSPLGETLAVTLLGDMVSYYLAVYQGRDPSATEALSRVRSATGPEVPVS